MQLKIKRGFLWAFRGCDVVSFESGQTVDTEDQDLINVSVHEGGQRLKKKSWMHQQTKLRNPQRTKEIKCL